MKVAYINCLASRHGMLGVEKKIQAQTLAIRELGLDMDVFLVDQTCRMRSPAFHFYPQAKGWLSKRISPFYRYGRVSMIVQRERYDVLLLRYSGADFSFFSALFQQNNIPIVTEHHTKELPETYTYRSSFPQRKLSIWMERFLGPRILKKASGLIAMTDEIKVYELGRIGTPIPACTIPNGISLDEIPFSRHAPYDGARLNVLCLADRFEPWQGLDRVILGLSRYEAQRPQVRVLVVGDVPEQLRSLARSVLGEDSKRIAFLGRLDGMELEDVFNTSHIAVSSLALFRKSMKEACALKTREYMARGLPFVLGHVDPDIPSDSEFALAVLADDTPVDMAKVAVFAQNVLSRSDIPTRMRAFAQSRLDWKIKMKQTWEFLQTLF